MESNQWTLNAHFVQMTKSLETLLVPMIGLRGVLQAAMFVCEKQTRVEGDVII